MENKTWTTERERDMKDPDENPLHYIQEDDSVLRGVTDVQKAKVVYVHLLEFRF